MQEGFGAEMFCVWSNPSQNHTPKNYKHGCPVWLVLFLLSGEGQSSRGSSTNESHLFSRWKHFHHWIQPHERAPASPVENCTSPEWIWTHWCITYTYTAICMSPKVFISSSCAAWIWKEDYCFSYFPPKKWNFHSVSAHGGCNTTEGHDSDYWTQIKGSESYNSNIFHTSNPEFCASRKTWTSRYVFKRWTPVMEFCCPSMTPTPA